RDRSVTGVQTCALPIWLSDGSRGDGSVAGGGELGQERIPHQRRHVAATEVSGESFVRNVHLGQPGHVSAQIPIGVGRGSSRCSQIGSASCRERGWLTVA